MAGNVWEWCLNLYKLPEDEKAVCLSDERNQYRVIRGGSWNSTQVSLRASLRSFDNADDRSHGLGFRLVKDIP